MKKKEPEVEKKNEENLEIKTKNENNEKKSEDINIAKNDSEKENILRNKLQARLKTLQRKSNTEEKNTHSRKSQFIMYRASLLQQKMTESHDDVSNDNSGISNVSEKNEITSTVTAILLIQHNKASYKNYFVQWNL